MRPGMDQVFAFQIDGGTLGIIAQSTGMKQGRRPAGIGLEKSAQLPLERRDSLYLLI